MKAERWCCACGKFLGYGHTSDGQPTHGYCDKCYAAYMAELDKIEKEKKKK